MKKINKVVHSIKLFPHKAHLINRKVCINFPIHTIFTPLCLQRSTSYYTDTLVSKNQSKCGMSEYLSAKNK